MPFTPFHFGPGLLTKSILGRYFSFTSFVLSQVVIDVETAYHLIRNEWPLHRALHTLLGGTMAGVVVGVLVHVGGRLVDRHSRWFRGSIFARWHECELAAAVFGGAVGGASHSVLDSMTHSDVQPFSPFATDNPLLGVIGAGALHLGCVVAGIAAVGVLIVKTRGGTKRLD
jgi:hypothetical protein